MYWKLSGFTWANVHRCGNLKVVVDGGEITRNNKKKRKSEVFQAYHSVKNAIDEIEVGMSFLEVTFFVGKKEIN